jgi:hypothetical protein
MGGRASHQTWQDEKCTLAGRRGSNTFHGKEAVGTEKMKFRAAIQVAIAADIRFCRKKISTLFAEA